MKWTFKYIKDSRVGHINSHEDAYGDIATIWKDVETNGRLIAAAPDLLRACKAIVNVKFPSIHRRAVAIVHAAIAKAEGKDALSSHS